MELRITSDRENKLLKRREISFEVDHEGATVDRSALTRELCKKLNLHPDSTVIPRIDQGYGTKRSTGVAHAYQSKELLEKYEPKSKLARIAKKAAKNAEGAGASEKKEE